MISLLEVAERSQKGPKMDETAWNMGIFDKMNELVKRYDITAPDDPPYFNEDDEIVDKVFEAAIDYLAERGVYCITNGRIINFTEGRAGNTSAPYRRARRAQPHTGAPRAVQRRTGPPRGKKLRPDRFMRLPRRVQFRRGRRLRGDGYATRSVRGAARVSVAS
jgi:hypothetical protein